MCVYACVYACVCVCVCVCAVRHASNCAYKHVSLCVHMCIQSGTGVIVCAHVRTCIYFENYDVWGNIFLRVTCNKTVCSPVEYTTYVTTDFQDVSVDSGHLWAGAVPFLQGGGDHHQSRGGIVTRCRQTPQPCNVSSSPFYLLRLLLMQLCWLVLGPLSE